VDGLQQNDCAWTTPEQKEELRGLGLAIGDNYDQYPSVWFNGRNHSDFTIGLMGWHSQEGSVLPDWKGKYFLPYEEFLRRARLTAAKLRKEEESKPLAPWTLVRVTSTKLADTQWGGKQGRILDADAYGNWNIYFPDQCDVMHFNRSEFTIITDNK